MFQRILNFYRISPAIPAKAEYTKGEMSRLKKLKWSFFISATFGYGLYYICRLSLNVVKKPIVDSGLFNETELGIIGAALFFAYAAGKLFNGFMADRSNIKHFFATGLLVAALVNLCLGFTHSFVFFAVLWGFSGWFQSMGAPSCIVGLTRWFDDRQRGTFYGLWSASHNIGEGMTPIVIAAIVNWLGWRYGFVGAGIIGLIGVLFICICFYDRPESFGYPSVNLSKATASKSAGSEKSPVKGSETSRTTTNEEFNQAQRKVLHMPAIWILAFASAFMYVSRYAINSWGIFYLQSEKGYSMLDASFIYSISPICGVIGTVTSGFVSDKLFGGRRNIPALIFGLMNVVALCIFLLIPGTNKMLDVFAMILFGLSIGVLICFLGGLMAVDIAPREASGAAAGIVGMASYIGAGIQDIVSGMLIQGHKTMIAGKAVYDFTYVYAFWIGAALMSVLLCLIVWNAKRKE